MICWCTRPLHWDPEEPQTPPATATDGKVLSGQRATASVSHARVRSHQGVHEGFDGVPPRGHGMLFVCLRHAGCGQRHDQLRGTARVCQAVQQRAGLVQRTNPISMTRMEAVTFRGAMKIQLNIIFAHCKAPTCRSRPGRRVKDRNRAKQFPHAAHARSQCHCGRACGGPAERPCMGEQCQSCFPSLVVRVHVDEPSPRKPAHANSSRRSLVLSHALACGKICTTHFSSPQARIEF